MAILRKTVRPVAITIAVLFIALSLLGIFGVWLASHKAAGIALKGIGIIETATGVVDAGVERVDDLIAKSRTEVRQASETIAAIGDPAKANRPVLDALNERLETRLVQRIAEMQQALAPVRDAVEAIGNAVSQVSVLPMMADRAPRLHALNETFTRLEGMAVDATQLHNTLKALVNDQATEIPAETVPKLTGLTQRIDTRLGVVQAHVQGVQTDIAALQVRMDTRKSRVQLVCNLIALLATLMLAWISYSQIVVIRHCRR